MSEANRKRCFFEITINNVDSGRITFELFDDISPLTSENFRKLCTGEAGVGEVHGKPLYYKGIIFHRIIKNFMIQSGDFINSNGSGGESIYGKTFDDENFKLRHDKPFLLSMANRGKNTNSSQFFITTAPATHLDGIHTVFGKVISGIDVVKVIEDLPVDRNSRPLDEVMVKSCGELVRQTKVKKDKKLKKAEKPSSSESSSSQESSEDEKLKKKKKKKKRDKKHQKKATKIKNVDSSVEEGEIESDLEELNPMVSITKINPDEIPEVSNKFLMRSEEVPVQKSDNGSERKFGWSKRQVPNSRSARLVKGRGSFRYRSKSRSRSRSLTPEHWKAASRKLIKLTDYEKIEEEKKVRDEEIKRRTEERKKRHESMATGDAKKPFYEVSQENVIASAIVEQQPNLERQINKLNDPNELDYEIDEEEFRNKRREIVQKDTKKRDNSNLLRRKSRSKEHDNRDKRDFRTMPHSKYDYDPKNRTQERRRETRRSRSRNRDFKKSSLSPKKTHNNEIEDLERKVTNAKKLLEMIGRKRSTSRTSRTSIDSTEKSKQRKRNHSPA